MLFTNTLSPRCMAWVLQTVWFFVVMVCVCLCVCLGGGGSVQYCKFKSISLRKDEDNVSYFHMDADVINIYSRSVSCKANLICTVYTVLSTNYSPDEEKSDEIIYF